MKKPRLPPASPNDPIDQPDQPGPVSADPVVSKPFSEESFKQAADQIWPEWDKPDDDAQLPK